MMKLFFGYRRKTFWRRLAIAIAAPFLASAGVLVATGLYWYGRPALADERLGAFWLMGRLRRLPALWSIAVLVGVVAVYLVCRLSDRRSRRRWFLAALSAFTVAALVAWLLVALGLDLPADRQATDHAAQLTAARKAKLMAWTQPEQGQLGGRVTGQDDTGFVLQDLSGKFWYVSTTSTTPGLQYAVFLRRVRVVGETDQDGYFVAREIRPWDYHK